MKKILFPTDFSDNTANALNYAIAIVNRLEIAHLTIVHTFTIPTNVGPVVSLEGHLQNDVKAEMNRIVNRIQPLLAKGIVLETMIKRGDTIPTIASLAEAYDLVIMGTQGATGLKEIFLGSITNGVLKKTKIPVFVVPKNYQFKPLKNMVLSVDNDTIRDTKGVSFIKQLLDTFKADLMLFHTEEQAADKGFDRNVIKLFDKVGYSIDFNFAGNSINESIEDMVVDYDIDLLCMVKRERGFLESLFHQSVTSKEVFHTNIPMLVLHDS